MALTTFALAVSAALFVATPDVAPGGPTAPASPPEPVARADAHDRGTRWVYLAALGGLLAGGLIAYRKKKDAAGK